MPTFRRKPAMADPDVQLIALCAQHVVNREAFNRDGGMLDLEDDPLWAAYERTRDAINEAKPQSLEGVVAKARTAKVEARALDGSDDPEHTPAAKWAWDVVNDLLRLNGEGMSTDAGQRGQP